MQLALASFVAASAGHHERISAVNLANTETD